MILETKELEKMIQHYDDLYEKNYHEFMTTGMSRYEKAYHRAEDIADALRTALNAKDESEELATLRGKISGWRVSAERIKQVCKETGKEIGPAEMLLDNIISTAKDHGA